MRDRDTIAIVGHACRLPGGVTSPETLWQLLVDGRDAVTEIPAERWDRGHFLHPDRTPGKAYTRSAGTLDDVAGFDAAFFGLAPREAEQMDPQQRLLLELTWEALERGGHVPERLAGSNCAVYVGISGTDYADIRQGDPAGANAYFMLGSTLSIAANRISYLFDFRGPSMAIDTACSSALVALHEAFHAVRQGRADLAVVGAVNLLLSPFPFVGFSQASMLSPSGRCKTFDKSADGYVRAEGGGVVILKRLAAARRDGDPILAVVKAVGVNADGRTPGIAQPSGARQEELLRRVYGGIDADPGDLVYFEAHGTGTAIGDPIEAGAIGRALGQRRPRNRPLPIGSVKSNIGHLEPASGMAGLVKAIEVLRHGAVPSTLHVSEPNPAIDFAGLNLAIADSPAPIARGAGPALVGVNSFGFGGANAHVVLEEYSDSRSAKRPRIRSPLYISAKEPAALRSVAANVATVLRRDSPPPLYDLAYTLARRRSAHPHRLVLHGPSPTLIDDLDAIAAGAPPPSIASGQALGASAKVAFVYSGNGAQWIGMGRRLLAEDPVFRAAVERVDALVLDGAGWSVIEGLEAPQASSRMADTCYAQPMLFAVQAGITASLAACGLRPAAVAGHSVGEIAAACAAGALTTEQAVHVILCRSAVQGETRGQGGMAAVQFGAERARAILADYRGEIELAADNAPAAVTVAGSNAALARLQEQLLGERVESRKLDLDYAFHSRCLDPLRDLLRRKLGVVDPVSATIPLYSTVTGGLIDGAACDADYWWRNVRLPVRFREAVSAMAADGCNLFVEIGPHPILQGYIRQILRSSDVDGLPLAALDKQESDAARLTLTVDRAYCAGAALDWDRIFPHRGVHVDLPTYPWQRERHWFPVTAEARGPLYGRDEGSLLGRRLEPKGTVWERFVDVRSPAFLADHGVAGAPVFPAAGFVEMALEASRQLFDADRHDIEQLEIRRPMVLEAPRMVQFAWIPDLATFRILSRPYLGAEDWTVHATGRLTKALPDDFPERVRPERAQPALGAPARSISGVDHYALAARLGLDYGPAFQTVAGVSVSGNAAVVALDGGRIDGADLCILHPALLDGCLQGLFDLLAAQADPDGDKRLYLPAQIGRVRVRGAAKQAATCEIALRRRSPRSIVADFTLRDREGSMVAEALGARFQQFDLTAKTTPLQRYAFDPVPLVPGSKGPVLAPKAIQIEGFDGAGLLDGLAASWDGDAWRDALAARPDLLAELTLIARCALMTSPAADGDLPSAGTLEHFLDSSPTVAPLHDAVVATVAAALRHWPRHRRLRVLEAGGGSVGLTRRLLALLPGFSYDYTVLSLDADTFARTGSDLAGLGDVRCSLFDPAEPDRDAPPRGGFDLVISVNALGAWSDPHGAVAALAGFGRDGAGLVIGTLRAGGWLDFVAGQYRAAGRRFPIGRPPTLTDGGIDALQDVTLEDAGGAIVLAAGLKHAAVPPAPFHVDAGPWLILAGTSGAEAAFASAVRHAFDAIGQRVLSIHPSGSGAGSVDTGSIELAVDDSEAWRDLLGMLVEAESPPRGIIHLAGFRRTSESGDDRAALQRVRCGSVLAIAQGVSGLAQAPRLILATSGAVDAAAPRPRDGAFNELVDASLWGLARVLRNETPGVDIRSLDLQGDDLAALVPSFLEELESRDTEDEVVLGPDRRIGFRLNARPVMTLDRPGDSEVLSFGAGSLDRLRWESGNRRAPAAGEVEIEVRAAGLNFRDVMLALGMLPDEAVENGFAGATLGMESAGVITRVGDGVTGFAPGDAVLCFAPACFASHVVVRTTAVVRKPDDLDFAAAATIPTVFFTVYYALNKLADLRRGERILIHGAAGGVGLAAIQYARHVGADIFATAGSGEKRDLVRLCGVAEEHILDSRTLAFADRIMALTGGEGVDVVLNSLAGEAIHRSLAVLRPFGRFLELGKRDFFANTALGLRPFRNNISYFGIDADQLMAVRPDLASRLFGEMMDLFKAGVFRPLPYRLFSGGRISDAFRHMQQARHLGKIVVIPARRHPAEHADPASGVASSRFTIDPEAAYLVTGGLGGFGLETARWLAAKGARHLVLMGRRGAAADAAREALRAFAEGGVDARAVACDVADPAAVANLVSGIAAERPLKGVFHAAAVYDDAAATNLSWDRFERVLAPKLGGGWALHQATLDQPLDCFVLFSSVTALLGNPGQANYVAANLSLEALARARRAAGLPGLAVGWSAIADAGYLARHGDVLEDLSQKMGVAALSAAAALRELERLLNSDHPAVVTLAALDWRRLRAALPSLAAPRFAGIAGARESAGDAVDLKKLLAELSPDEVRTALIEMVSEEVGAVLRIPPDRIDPHKSVFDLGMDSLMALELRLGIEERFDVELPGMAVVDGITVARLAERIRDHLWGDAPSAEIETVDALLARHADESSVDSTSLVREVATIRPHDARREIEPEATRLSAE